MRLGLPISPLTGALFAVFGIGAFLSQANADNLPPQYRFRNEAIPGASALEPVRSKFSSQQARDYLDKGAALWAQQKDCVSCHTHGIYLATRPAMTPYWGPPPAQVRDFFAAKARELQASGDRTLTAPTKMAYLARGLAAWDAQFASETSSETDAALRHVLTMQGSSGNIDSRNSWPPLNSTSYHATVMTALAVADAPQWFPGLVEPSVRQAVDRLLDFLRDTPPKNDHEHLLLLWASSRFPSLLGPEQRKEIVQSVLRQQRPDGGWSTRTFATLETWGGGKRAQELVAEPDYDQPLSDGYQTGLVIFVLREIGLPKEEESIQKGIRWLRSQQRESGRWWTPSLNTKSRFHYITYSGTAYAALALARCDSLEPASP